jgi:hypothetical protein
MALNSPDKFKKFFIKGFKPNGDMIVKHKDTNVPCQIGIKIDTYSDEKPAKQKGGSRRAMTRRNKKYSNSKSKSRFSKSRRNKTMRR